MRQIAGTFAELEKTRLVKKLTAARRRKREETGRCEGRKPIAEQHPAATAFAKELARVRKRKPSLRQLSTKLAERDFVNEKGKPFGPSSASKMPASS